MGRSFITPEVRRFTDEGGASNLTADAHRPAGVRPPDERNAPPPETLPASAVKTDITDLAPREPCRVRIVNVTRCQSNPRLPGLTDGEAMRLAAALRHLRALYGGWDVLASVMGVSVKTLGRVIAGRQHPGAGLARKAAMAAGKSLDTLLTGPVDASKCPTCGAVRGAS